MDFVEIPILRERASRIFAFLLVYKDGKLEDGNIVNSYRITKFLYGAEKREYQANVITELKELAKFGLIEKQEAIIKNRKNYIIRPNIDKFVDLFIEYFKLDFNEEERQRFKEWFKSADWKILEPIDKDWRSYKVINNIFETIGLNLRYYATIYFTEKEILEKGDLKITKEAFIELASVILREIKGQNLDIPELGISIPTEVYFKFFIKLLTLPDSILEKISKIQLSSFSESILFFQLFMYFIIKIVRKKTYDEIFRVLYTKE